MSHPRRLGALAVILWPADYDVWLDPSIREVEHLQPLLRPYLPEEYGGVPDEHAGQQHREGHP